MKWVATPSSFRFLLVALCIVSATSHAQMQDPPARAALRSRMEAVLRDLATTGDAALAERELEMIVAADAGFAAPRYNLAVLHEQRRNWRTAASWFGEFLKLDSTSAFATRARREVVVLRRVDSLWNMPGGAKKVSYADAVARSRLFIRAGLLRQAVASAAEAVTIDSTRWEAYAITASALAEQQSFPEAKRFVERARAFAPSKDSPAIDALYQRIQHEEQYRVLGASGTAALSAGDYRRAAGEFEQATALFPGRPEYRLAAASSYELLGDSATAAGLATPVAASSDPKARAQAGAMLRRLRLFGSAADSTGTRALTTAQVAAPPRPKETLEQASRRHHEVATRLMDQRNWQEAASAYRAAIEAVPNNSLLFAGLGDALAGDGKWTEAAIEYGNAVKLDPDNGKFWDLFGNSLYLSGRKLEGVAALEEAVRLAPMDSRYRANLDRVRKAP